MSRLILITFLLFAGITGCYRDPEVKTPQVAARPQPTKLPVYHLAVHPLHNPAKLILVYQPLIDYLNARLKGARLSLEPSRDYATFESKYRARTPDILLPNPWQTLQAMKSGYRVIAMAGEPKDFKGIFIVRKEVNLNSPVDLKGKAVSYPSPTALAACIMPQQFLHDHGINVTKDIENRYVGSQESSIMNAFQKLTAAGATWPPPWRAFQKDHPKEAAELKVIWETESLINNSVMVRNDIPASVGEQVGSILVTLDKTAEGKGILAELETARFIPSTDAEYDIVRRYVSRFEREVRPVEMR